MNRDTHEVLMRLASLGISADDGMNTLIGECQQCGRRGKMLSHCAHCDEFIPAYIGLDVVPASSARSTMAELIEALRELHAIDERKLAATARRPYAIGISTIRERVERNRALLSRLEKDRS